MIRPEALRHPLWLIWIWAGMIASSAWASPQALYINGVRIRGIEHIARLKPMYADTAMLRALWEACEGDGLDEVVFADEEGRMLLAYGAHIFLYTQRHTQVRSALYAGKPVRVLMIDDENKEFDLRPPLSRPMAITLVGIALAGLVGGIIWGLLARRGLAGLGRDPLAERAFYGFIIGVTLALLLYGMSERRLDLKSLFKWESRSHLDRFILDTPDSQGREGETTR